MAENITAPGAGTVLAADDIGGVLYPRSKIAHGADGSATDTSDAAPFPTKLVTATAGGWSAFRRVSTATENSAVIKASAGQLGGIIVGNVNAAMRYLKLYDMATGPAETDTPVLVIPVPGGSTAGGGVTLNFGPGIAFATGIGMRLVTGIADNNDTAVAADELVVSAWYK